MHTTAEYRWAVGKAWTLHHARPRLHGGQAPACWPQCNTQGATTFGTAVFNMVGCSTVTGGGWAKCCSCNGYVLSDALLACFCFVFFSTHTSLIVNHSPCRGADPLMARRKHDLISLFSFHFWVRFAGLCFLFSFFS
ncbi:hypothetical protein COCMIDRAFT_107570 [Bipolaris oryzae ATCC 44560]|uniref:Uncharacterized protein n=1 Tax=Bipolaris oryzae ATCC 44560 TaxID=930090 RepID=W6YNI5_COCMI|nr:uncharacterized protein COCMIDRAFT_107570 [Bipolaris oryzae ATCC 44560]EUC40912.1 hypothetical protein COCMIDRAFT_107570 [Bipolaris oryzae ATCC 44560]